MADPPTDEQLEILRDALLALQQLIVHKITHWQCYLVEWKSRLQRAMAQVQDELDALPTTPPPEIQTIIDRINEYLGS